MTTPITVLIPAKIAENAQTTQYTSTLVYTIIDSFTATNYSTAPATISVNLVTSGDTAGNQNLIIKARVLQPGETYSFPELIGAELAPSDFISTLAGTASAINIRASGRVFS